MNTAVYAAALTTGCTRRQAEVLATWVDSQGIDDTAEQLGISNRRVLQHLRQARHLLNVPHNGKLVAVVLSGGAYTRSSVAAR